MSGVWPRASLARLRARNMPTRVDRPAHSLPRELLFDKYLWQDYKCPAGAVPPLDLPLNPPAVALSP